MNIDEKEIARIQLRLKIYSFEGNAFEQLFSKIMRIKNPNFRQVKPNGREGDRKNDGFDPDSGVFYQVYAPQDINVSVKDAIKKLDEDFKGLLDYWPQNGFEVKEFYYVVNDKYKGLPSSVLSKLQELHNSYPSIKIDKFDAQDLENIFMGFSEEDMMKVIGFIPQGIHSNTNFEIYRYINGKFPIFDLMQKKLDTESEDEQELDAKLIKLADYLLSKLYTQQIVAKRVNPGIDIKDLNFTMSVEKVAFDLVGKSLLEKKSISELFMLCIASHFYNCGMILNKWERNLLDLADSLTQDEEAQIVNNAGKFISINKDKIYGEFEQLYTNNLFVPKEENQLKKQLAELLVTYLDYKLIQTKTREVKGVNSDNEIYNEIIRKDFLYNQQLKRTEQCVRNLESVFVEKLGNDLSKKMIRDLASVCISWKNNYKAITNLDECTEYYIDEDVCLQFIAGILRLSVSLRPDSYLAIKSVLKESIKDYLIKVNGCCENPSEYYQVKDYLDYVEEEIKNFNYISENWKNVDNRLVFELYRKRMNYNKEVFEPRDGIKFSLDQNRILNLLMGSNLYGDEWVSLRELYQNSLDACRCVIAQDENYIGKIEFGIEESDGEKYLYCKDNGIGMDRYIIENYLLKVGNSYYQSEDFIRKQSKWKNYYKPVSQFGIGILSCFMIGSRIEIVSRLSGQSEYVSCCIEGLQEYFYYNKKIDSDTKESIGERGTIVKIRLKPGININNNRIEKIGVVWINEACELKDEIKEVYKDTFNDWNNHLYRHLDIFITRIPEKINVNVRLKDQQLVPIKNKPFYLHYDKVLSKEDLNIIDREQQNYKEYEISCKNEGLEFHSIIVLPLGENVDYYFHNDYIVRPSALSSDGIALEQINFANDDKDQIDLKYYQNISKLGYLNFIGEEKPQLSVDRQRVIRGWASKDTLLDLLLQIIEKVFITTNDHLHQLGKNIGEKMVETTWHFVNKFLEDVAYLVPKCILDRNLGSFTMPSLSTVLGIDITIQEFLNKQDIIIPNSNYHKIHKLDNFVITIILMKLATAERAKNYEGNLDIHFSNIIVFHQIIDRIINYKEKYYYRDLRLTIPIMDEIGLFKDYDIVTSFLPFVSKRLFNKINFYKKEEKLISDVAYFNEIINYHNLNQFILDNILRSGINISPQNPYFTNNIDIELNLGNITTCLVPMSIIEYSIIISRSGSFIVPGRYSRYDLEKIYKKYR